MHVIQRVPRRMHRRMYSPLDRQVVNGVGLGEVDGLFNIGKMFSRLTHITPRSFQFKNIAGAVGSLAMFTASAGLSSLAPKLTGAHSTLSKDVGYGVMAAAAVAGAVVAAPVIGGALGIGGTAATGTGLTVAGEGMMAAGTGVLAPAAEAAVGSSFFTLPTVASTGSTLMTAGSGVLAPVAEGGILSTIGSGISAVGSGLMNVVKALPFVSTLMGGGGGQQQPQYVDYGPAGPTPQQIAAQQAYDAQVAAAQASMYVPSGYTPNIPYTTPQYAGAPITGAGDSGSGYGDLRSPYTLTSEDGQTQTQVDPRTGQVIQASMFPDLSITTWLIVGGVALAGLYVMRDDPK